MSLASLSDWIAWGGIVIPLSIAAISAAFYVKLENDKRKKDQYNRFYKLMDQIGMNEGSIASKMAAISELKKYPEYKDVILRLCVSAQIGGPEAHLLENEFDLTARHFGAHRSKEI